MDWSLNFEMKSHSVTMRLHTGYFLYSDILMMICHDCEATKTTGPEYTTHLHQIHHQPGGGALRDGRDQHWLR
jgi:hypothetical protein